MFQSHLKTKNSYLFVIGFTFKTQKDGKFISNYKYYCSIP